LGRWRPGLAPRGSVSGWSWRGGRLHGGAARSGSPRRGEVWPQRELHGGAARSGSSAASSRGGGSAAALRGAAGAVGPQPCDGVARSRRGMEVQVLGPPLEKGYFRKKPFYCA